MIPCWCSFPTHTALRFLCCFLQPGCPTQLNGCDKVLDSGVPCDAAAATQPAEVLMMVSNGKRFNSEHALTQFKKVLKLYFTSK